MKKVVHFIAVKSTYSASNVAQVFSIVVVILHGVLKKIVLDRDAKFTSTFWKEFCVRLGIPL